MSTVLVTHLVLKSKHHVTFNGSREESKRALITTPSRNTTANIASNKICVLCLLECAHMQANMQCTCDFILYLLFTACFSPGCGTMLLWVQGEPHCLLNGFTVYNPENVFSAHSVSISNRIGTSRINTAIK